MNETTTDPKLAGRQPGKVTSTRTVWCESCERYEVAPEDSTAPQSTMHWMRAGWSWIMGSWFCPTCVVSRPKPRGH